MQDIKNCKNDLKNNILERDRTINDESDKQKRDELDDKIKKFGREQKYIYEWYKKRV